MRQKPKIGIMQGRLSQTSDNIIQSFPKTTWKKEFELASELGYDGIEWIFDEFQPNPILLDEGISEIRTLKKKFNISINSICADYFMTKKLFQESKTELEKNLEVFKKLIVQANKLEISMIEIPLVDSASLKSDEDKTEIMVNLKNLLSFAESNNVIVVLETDLNPIDFNKFLVKFNHSNIMANYDSGNSASLGYNPKEELEQLSKWIKNVHIKDRRLRGTTVPLGTGDTNFELFFSILSKINYSGDLIIQGARIQDKQKTPEETCKTYMDFVKRYVDKYYNKF